MDLQAATTVAYNIVTSSAVVVGGVWAYFKFVRGRTFANRAELNVTANFDGSPDQVYFCATVTLKNTGLSRLPLNSDMKAIRIFGAAASEGDAGEVKWERISTLPILDQHGWLEAQETVTDTIVYQVPLSGQNGSNYAIYQVEAIVGARPRPITRKRVKWQALDVAFQSSGHATSYRDPPELINSSKKGSLIQRFMYRERYDDYGR
jgi:hypothetical protein